jgi:hypothetical protein
MIAKMKADNNSNVEKKWMCIGIDEWGKKVSVLLLCRSGI